MVRDVKMSGVVGVNVSGQQGTQGCGLRACCPSLKMEGGYLYLLFWWIGLDKHLPVTPGIELVLSVLPPFACLPICG